MSSVVQFVSQLQDTHFPSNVDKLFAGLEHLNSLSVVPDALTLQDELHSVVVGKGLLSENTNRAINGILRRHSVSKDWKMGPRF